MIKKIRQDIFKRRKVQELKYGIEGSSKSEKWRTNSHTTENIRNRRRRRADETWQYSSENRNRKWPKVLSWLVRWAYRAGTRGFCSALAALGGPVQNIFNLIVHYFNSCVSIAQQAGQAAVLGRLSLSVCL